MNILLTFVGIRTDMVKYFKYASENTGKVFACDCKFEYALTLADGYFISPQAHDDTYISTLTEYCKENSISSIIPLSNYDLSVLSKNKNKLQNIGIFVVISDEVVIDICLDRWKTNLFLKTICIKYPKSYIDLEVAKCDLLEGRLTFPLKLKPRFVSEKSKEIKIDTLEELELFYRKMQRNLLYKPDLHKDNLIIIREYISGDNYGLCLLNDLQGNFITDAVLRKISYSDEINIICQVEDSKQFNHIIKSLSSNLKHIAHIEIDCCLLKSGEIFISEINARFGSLYPFLHVAEADFPKQIIDWLKGLPVSSSYLNPIIGTKGCREKMLPVKYNFNF